MELGLLISPGCQRGESSGLLTRIAPTETVSLGAADEKLTAFLDLEESHAMTVIEVKPHCWAVFRELGSVVTVERKSSSKSPMSCSSTSSATRSFRLTTSMRRLRN